MRRTIDEIAAALPADRAAAAGLVKFLCAAGLADFKGERPGPRGKGAHVYEIRAGAAAQAGRMIRALEE